LGAVYRKGLGDIFKDNTLKQTLSEILFKRKVIKIYGLDKSTLFKILLEQVYDFDFVEAFSGLIN
jgi:hypothetical protein